jgi:zinc and cadmium transporter
MLVYIFGIISVSVISVISLVGIMAFWLAEEKTEKALIYVVSFAAGGLFGDAFFHLIPEAAGKNGFEITSSFLITFGILSSFAVERFLQWRHCHIPTSDEHPHSFAYMNLFGDAVHNLVDGIIVGGSYMASIPLGVATTIAVVFHEVPQELGDFSMLTYGGFTKRKVLTLNFLTALTSIVGAIFAFVAGSAIEGFVPLLIPFAAGNFIYIAGSDLIPELRKDTPELKKAALQMMSLVLGIIPMLFLLLLE